METNFSSSNNDYWFSLTQDSQSESEFESWNLYIEILGLWVWAGELSRDKKEWLEPESIL